METRSAAKRLRVELVPRHTPITESPPSPAPVESSVHQPDPTSSTTEPTVLVSGIHSLPIAILLDQIFPWLAPPANIPPDVIARGLDRWMFNWKLFTIQQVCRAWHRHAQTLVARYAAHVWSLRERDVVNHLTRPTPPPPAVSTTVVQLQLALMRPNRAPTMGGGRRVLFNISRSVWPDAYTQLPSTHWPDMFRACPRLVRLDLSCNPFDEALLAEILDAASSLCPHVQSLVLPMRTTSTDTQWLEETKLTELLARVLPKWTHSNGGLRALALPWHSFRCLAAQHRFLAMIAETCPRIAYLRDWIDRDELNGNDPRDYAGAGILFDVDFDTFDDVSRAMTQLEEWHWRIPPECERYVKAFAATARPQLQSLYLDYTVRHRRGERQFPSLSHDVVASLFQATPNLRHFALVTQRDFDSRLDLATPHDRIVQALEEHCPQLESLRIDVAGYLGTIPTVTDVGIRAVVRMAALRLLYIQPLHVSDVGILAIVDACMTRQLHDIVITLHPTGHKVNLMETVLQYLIDLDLSRCARRPRFVLRLRQSSVTKRQVPPLLDAQIARVHDKYRRLGHDTVVAVDSSSQCEFIGTLRWNFPEDPTPSTDVRYRRRA